MIVHRGSVMVPCHSSVFEFFTALYVEKIYPFRKSSGVGPANIFHLPIGCSCMNCEDGVRP